MESTGNLEYGRDHLYTFDESRLEVLRRGCAWLNDPKYFKRVKISPSAVIKMMMHGQSGVEKGIKKSGKPIEVMGLLLGRPDIDDPHSLIISDAQALPIEGFETKVIADDENVINYMIELGETNEMTRKERFCGWYHTHPFDVDVNSNCYLSTTDISTQLQWQRAEDHHGNPWLAIVIDPLRSLAKSRPELMAFRVYPPDYSPPLNETPDGTIISDDRTRVEKWGACWNRYYKLETVYYMSNLAQNTLGILKNNFLWMNTFTSTPTLEPEHQQRMAERICQTSSKLEAIDSSGFHSLGSRQSSGMSLGRAFPTGGEGDPSAMSLSSGSVRDDGSLTKSAQGGVDLAVEHCNCAMTQIAKNALFGLGMQFLHVLDKVFRSGVFEGVSGLLIWQLKLGNSLVVEWRHKKSICGMVAGLDGG
eukprot:gene2117-4137_t